MMLIVSIGLLYTYTSRNYQYVRRRVVVYLHVLVIHCRMAAFNFKNLTQSDMVGMRTANKWPQKCDGGPYNGADSVHWPFIYIYIKELPIYKKESGCIPPRFGDTLSDSGWFDFENLTQSEAREPPTSGHKSVVEGPTMVLIVSIGL